MLDFSHSKLAVERSVWSYSKVQRLVSFVIRGRRAFMNFKTEGLILDAGCGQNINGENINLAYEWQPGIDICCDLTKGLPLADNYVSGIFTEHCIEHIPFADAPFVFDHFYRVMKPGSRIRIIVPDLDIYVDRYVQARGTSDLSMPYASDDVREGGLYSPAMSVNRIFNAHGHKFIYDFSTMKLILEEAGFVEIKKFQFGVGDDQSLVLDSPGRAIESLYVEARKP